MNKLNDFIPVFLVALVAIVALFQMIFPLSQETIVGQGANTATLIIHSPVPGFGPYSPSLPVGLTPKKPPREEPEEEYQDCNTALNLDPKTGTPIGYTTTCNNGMTIDLNFLKDKYVCKDAIGKYDGTAGIPQTGSYTFTSAVPTTGSMTKGKENKELKWDATKETLQNKDQKVKLKVTAGTYEGETDNVRVENMNWPEEVKEGICGNENYGLLYLNYDPPQKDITTTIDALGTAITINLKVDTEIKLYTLEGKDNGKITCGKKAIISKTWFNSPGSDDEVATGLASQIQAGAIACLQGRGIPPSRFMSDIQSISREIGDSTKQHWAGLGDDIYFKTSGCPNSQNPDNYDITINYYKKPWLDSSVTETIAGVGLYSPEGWFAIIQNIPAELYACLINPPLNPNDADFKEISKMMTEANEKHSAFSLCCDDTP